MAACVGVMINKARPQEYIINAPPGTASINIANHPNPSNDNEPLKGSPKNNDNIKVTETPDTAEKTITGKLPYFSMYLPENTVNTAAPKTPTITIKFPFYKVKLSGVGFVIIAMAIPIIAKKTEKTFIRFACSTLNNEAIVIVASGIVAYNKPALDAVV